MSRHLPVSLFLIVFPTTSHFCQAAPDGIVIIQEDDLHNENDHGDGNDVEDQNLSMNRVQLDVHCSDPHRDSGRWMRA